MSKYNESLRCGNVDCLKKDCPHIKEHKYMVECEDECVHSGSKYKCYNLIEMRKIKLNRLKIEKIEP